MKVEPKDLSISEKSELPDTILDAKEVEYYSTTVAVWYAIALERDKSILTLAVAGLGFVLSILVATKDSISPLLFILFLVCFLFYLATIFLTLHIFEKSKTHIQEIIGGESVSDISAYDKYLNVLFFCSVLLSIAIVLTIASPYINKI